jgi:PAS domain S-box-containing protein
MEAHAGGRADNHPGEVVATASVIKALNVWREAERRWEATDPADADYRASGIAVVSAWLRYQELVGEDPGSFVLVADDEHRYVAVSDGVESALGYEASDLLGRQIEDIAAPDLVPGTPEAWQRFLSDGRQDGQFRLVACDGREVAMAFQARAHHPIPGFHVSRLRPVGISSSLSPSAVVEAALPEE